MKDKLQNSLGTFGIILYFVFSIVSCVMPFVILDTSFLWTFLLFAAIMFLGNLGNLLMFVLYIWAFVVAVQGPQDIFAIVFYLCFVAFVVPTVFAVIAALFKKK